MLRRLIYVHVVNEVLISFQMKGVTIESVCSMETKKSMTKNLSKWSMYSRMMFCKTLGNVSCKSSH